MVPPNNNEPATVRVPPALARLAVKVDKVQLVPFPIFISPAIETLATKVVVAVPLMVKLPLMVVVPTTIVLAALPASVKLLYVPAETVCAAPSN